MFPGHPEPQETSSEPRAHATCDCQACLLACLHACLSISAFILHFTVRCPVHNEQAAWCHHHTTCIMLTLHLEQPRLGLPCIWSSPSWAYTGAAQAGLILHLEQPRLGAPPGRGPRLNRHSQASIAARSLSLSLYIYMLLCLSCSALLSPECPFSRGPLEGGPG